VPVFQQSHRPLADVLHEIAGGAQEPENGQLEGNQAVADQLPATAPAAPAAPAAPDAPGAPPWWAAELDSAVAECAMQPLSATEAAEVATALDLARPSLAADEVAAVEAVASSEGGTFGGAFAPLLGLPDAGEEAPKGAGHHVEFRAYIPAALGAPLASLPLPTGLENQADFDAEVAAVPGAWLTEPGSMGNPLTGTTATFYGTDPRGPGGPGENSRMRTQLDIGPTDLDGSSTPAASTSCGVTERAWANVDGLSRPIGQLFRDSTRADNSQTFQWTPVAGGVDGAVQAHGCYPFVSDWVAPAIDYRLELDVRGDRVVFGGWHNGFPAYDLLVDGRVVYQWTPTDAGPNVWNLGFKRVSIAPTPVTL
jgi:hypothetical protein